MFFEGEGEFKGNIVVFWFLFFFNYVFWELEFIGKKFS